MLCPLADMTTNCLPFGDWYVIGVDRAQFDMDTESSELFLELAQTKMRRGTSIIVWLTCTGLIRSQSEFQLDRTATGYRGNGFGHMGLYPAELVVKSIKDVEVKQVSN
jgi:hypothetical protein